MKRKAWRLLLVVVLVWMPVVMAMVGAPVVAQGAGDGVSERGHGQAVTEGAPSYLGAVRQVAAGRFHTCALLEDGSVRCWGNNESGQLGNGTFVSSGVPVEVIGLGGRAKALAAGRAHTCAVLENGHVRCWGLGDFGQLGNGAFFVSTNVPVDVVGLGGRAKALAAGWAHTCALLEDGRVRCWGWNWYGQLGNGNTKNSNRPVDVVGLGGRAKALVTEGSYTCALLEDGRVRCWGHGGSTPMDVVGLGGYVRTLAAGGSHTCALLEDGRVRCWGGNYAGQLGNGTTEASSRPVDVVGLGGRAKALAAGGSHTCALLEDGRVRCWGWNKYGQLGKRSTENVTRPVDVVGLERHVKALAAGGSHTCALLEDGRVRCWGNNGDGQLGNSTFILGSTSIGVVGLRGRTQALAAGDKHTCALLEDGRVRCWGNNWDGQLGNGTTEDSSRPVDVVGLGERAKAIVAGGGHTCALLENGGVRCWGANGSGQLGNGMSGLDKSSSRPVDVVGLGGRAKALAAGYSHTCALLEDGRVRCWGNNWDGQLGNGMSGLDKSSSRPVDVVGLGGRVKALVAGENHTCAALEDGRVRCWGWNGAGQLGNGTFDSSSVPVEVVGLEGHANALAAGGSHTCALLEDGRVRCWGSNWHGQLGNGKWRDSSPRPVNVVGLGGRVKALAAGDEYTCAVLEDGSVRCWGANRVGQLGDGSVTERHTPVSVRGLARVTGLAAGGNHTCAVLTTRKSKPVLCWGSDEYGKLGRARDLIHTVPVWVVAEPVVRVWSNYGVGKPGSWFTIWGAGFPAGARASVWVNGRKVTEDVGVTATGEVMFFLHTGSAPEGYYTVAVEAGGRRGHTVLHLDRAAPWRDLEGGSPRYGFPAGVTGFSPRVRIFLSYIAGQ